MTALLVLMLACTNTADTGGETGGDSADSGGDSSLTSADCALAEVSPLTTSWNGGETISLSLDCADPTQVNSLSVELDGSTYQAVLGETSGSTLSATFVPDAQSSTGAKPLGLSVDGEAIEGETLRFALDPGELSQRVHTATTAHLGWGLPVAASVVNEMGRQLVISPSASDVLVGLLGEKGTWSSSAMGLNAMEVEVDNGATTGRYGLGARGFAYSDSANDIQAMVWPVLSTEGSPSGLLRP